ncbi:TldD/PmbA family protein [Kaustia mangrovi]|uniref:TldD/PmbA family protein n=1 Tax=Kaustia mangrovi TaxID=2593653 RepID=A0A7S8C2F3_9HYPH|nr:TldD/PmbA family protein [Kaustia mangrovi]QPC42145.1 TldD/PmbA family protein [Kaustia mangrovi]
MTEPDQKHLIAIADHALDLARRNGADQADVVIAESTSLSASVRLGALEDVERAEDRELGLRVFTGHSQAIVSTTDFSAKSLETLAERAVAMARIAPPDEHSGLADPDELAADWPDLDLRDAAAPDAEALQARALEAEDAARAVDGVTNSEGAGAGYGLIGVVLATSTGFCGAYRRTGYGISCSALAGEGTGMERDHDSASAVHYADLDDAAAIGRRAGERAVRRLSPRKVSSQTVPVVYDPRVSRSLLGHLAGAISGTAITRGTSFLKDRMGDQVFAPGIAIVDAPLRPRGLRSRPFDGEGIAGHSREIVSDGRLQTWVLDCYSARRLGLRTTGHASRGASSSPSPSVTNLSLMPGPLSPEALIGEIPSGLYVTELMGMGVNGVTGDYSRGASGFWIENGEIAYPVSEITIAGNLKDMFASLAPADDLVYRYGVDAPTCRVEAMTIAGT